MILHQLWLHVHIPIPNYLDTITCAIEDNQWRFAKKWRKKVDISRLAYICIHVHDYKIIPSFVLMINNMHKIIIIYSSREDDDGNFEKHGAGRTDSEAKGRRVHICRNN